MKMGKSKRNQELSMEVQIKTAINSFFDVAVTKNIKNLKF